MGRVRNSDVVAVRVVDVEAAAAVVVVGLPGPTVCRIGAVLKARRLDASEDGIERLLVDGEGVVVGVEALDSGEDQEWKDSSRSLRLALISSSQTGSGNERLQHPLHPPLLVYGERALDTSPLRHLPSNVREPMSDEPRLAVVA